MKKTLYKPCQICRRITATEEDFLVCQDCCQPFSGEAHRLIESFIAEFCRLAAEHLGNEYLKQGRKDV